MTRPPQHVFENALKDGGSPGTSDVLNLDHDNDDMMGLTLSQGSLRNTEATSKAPLEAFDFLTPACTPRELGCVRESSILTQEFVLIRSACLPISSISHS